MTSYKHSKGLFEVKCTDNRKVKKLIKKCIKFVTDKLQDVKKFEKLNLYLSEQMQQIEVFEEAMEI